MDQYSTKRLAIARRQAKALERIADALEYRPQLAELGEIVEAGAITWQDAVRIMSATCASAEVCGPECPMNEWCQIYNAEGIAPAKWLPVENGTEAEE